MCSTVCLSSQSLNLWISKRVKQIETGGSPNNWHEAIPLLSSMGGGGVTGLKPKCRQTLCRENQVPSKQMLRNRWPTPRHGAPAATHTQAHRLTHSHTYTHTDWHTDTHTGTTDWQTNTPTNTHTSTQSNTHRCTDRHTHTRTHSQTLTHTQRH